MKLTPKPPEEWELDLLARYPRLLAIGLIMVVSTRKHYSPHLPEFAYWCLVVTLGIAGFFIGYQMPPVDTNPLTGFAGNAGAGMLGCFIGVAILPTMRGLWDWYNDLNIRLPKRKVKPE